MTNYWIAVASAEHARRGKAGFMQVNHGKKAPLMRVKPGDWVVFYSPKNALEGDEKCQSFTAIGQASGDNLYQFAVTDDFTPFRRAVQFYPAQDASILPLIDALAFISNKKSWGYPFRFGFFEINSHDFDLIRAVMLGNKV